MAFKGGTDDLRASPGLVSSTSCSPRGARVTVHDPLVRADAIGSGWRAARSGRRALAAALEGGGGRVVTTNAPEYAGARECCLAAAAAARWSSTGGARSRPTGLGAARYVGVGRASDA